MTDNPPKAIQSLLQLDTLLKAVKRASVLDGDFAECGVAGGGSALAILQTLKEVGATKTLHLFDTFAGQPDLGTPEEKEIWRARPHIRIPGGDYYGLDAVKENLAEHANNIRFYPGLFSETLPTFSSPLCFVHADADQYLSMCDIFRMVERLLIPGGVLVVHDYGHPAWQGVARAAAECIHLDRYHVEKGQFQRIYTRRRLNEYYRSGRASQN